MSRQSHNDSGRQPDPGSATKPPGVGGERADSGTTRKPDAETLPVASEPSETAATQAPAKVTVAPAMPTPEPTVSLWRSLLVQPLLVLVAGAMVIVLLGVAQRYGYISAGGSGGHSHASGGASDTRYICPMMCTPPQSEPGRCPVCAMELVPASAGGGDSDSQSIHLDPASRRVANIQTVAVTSMPMTRTLRAIGELSYDEGTQRTISAYVDGRLDRLFADYTGMVVKKGDHLALLYSPRLYSGQVELLLAKQARNENRSEKVQRIIGSGEDLYGSAKERLIELGMTVEQIADLEKAGEANSRLLVCAPISGTVIEKMADEGEYVKEGQALFKVADLSTVWLMLELFPEDAATIRYGQQVDARVQSLPNRTFEGRVAFIDPQVNPKTRTVGVRVVIPNNEGVLRVGDYAKATVDVPLSDATETLVFDPELANKWISPRHPQVVADAAGDCPVCGIDLVPSAQFGFTDQPSLSAEALMIPRDAVLMAGENSVVYVETEPGRFEIRRVVLGPNCGDQLVIRNGLKLGELVATRGNFLIDSQMQLAGNPSLIDPTRVEPMKDVSPMDQPLTPAVIEALAELSAKDRPLAESQKICPVRGFLLGSMGAPPKVDVNGKPIFICCEGCREDLLSNPDKYLAVLTSRESSGQSPEAGAEAVPVPVPLSVGPETPPPPVFQVPETRGPSPDSNPRKPELLPPPQPQAPVFQPVEATDEAVRVQPGTLAPPVFQTDVARAPKSKTSTVRQTSRTEGAVQ